MLDPAIRSGIAERVSVVHDVDVTMVLFLHWVVNRAAAPRSEVRSHMAVHEGPDHGLLHSHVSEEQLPFKLQSRLVVHPVDSLVAQAITSRRGKVYHEVASKQHHLNEERCP